MSPPVELILRFDGIAPGLTEHVLSLSAFKKSLPLLLTAVQKTIDIVAGESELDTERRKKPTIGKNFDLQIVSIDGNSLAVKLGLAFLTSGTPVMSPEYFTDIAVQAVKRFTHDVEAEWSHRGTRDSIRRFLTALPSGIAEQSYEARADGTTLSSVNLSSRKQHEKTELSVPRSKEIQGVVYGVTFDQSSARVRIRDTTGVLHTCRASSEVVEMAVNLHKSAVVGTVIVNRDQVRLITIRENGAPRSTMSSDERLAYLTGRWKEVFQRLAE